MGIIYNELSIPQKRTRTKTIIGVNGEIDKCHCFSCGWAGTIEEMISELYGYQDEGKFGKKWLIKRFNTVEIETRPNIMEGFNARQNFTIHNSKISYKKVGETGKATEEIDKKLRKSLMKSQKKN